MSNSRDDQLAWVRAVMASMDMNPLQLAKRAGINPSTLHRPLNDPAFPGMLSGRTMAAIAEVAGLNPMEFPAARRGLSEPDAEPFRFETPKSAVDNFNRAVRELTQGRAGRDPWVMKSYALELAGVLPGDVMVVDLNIAPRPRDIVCAQIYDWSQTKAETVFRRFDPPFLMTASLRMDKEKPVMVDGTNVVIKGVVETILRARQ